MTVSTPLLELEPDTGDALVSRVWVQVTALVLLIGIAVLGFLGYRAYTADPPIAAQVRTPTGGVVYTGDDVTAGQKLFLRKGLMEYGSIFGHGAYLGPDFTADYLHRAADIATRGVRRRSVRHGARQVIADFKTNRYDPESDTVTYTEAQAEAFDELVGYYAKYFGAESASKGLLPEAITDPAEIRQLTAYFAWSAWAGSTLRPDKDYTYTNNWPPEPLVGNTVTANVVVWSVLSLIVLLAGIGVLFAAFGRWGERLGWRGRQADTISFRPPDDVRSRRRSGRAPTSSSSSACCSSCRPWSVPPASTTAPTCPASSGSTWPGGCPTTWCAPGTSSWRSSGPRRRSWPPGSSSRRSSRAGTAAAGAGWPTALLGALAVVVFGSMIGRVLDIHGWLPSALHALGMQGWEYLDLGRFWQVLLTLGLFFWAVMLFRGLAGRLARQSAAEHAVAVLLHRAGDPGVLRGRSADQSESSYTVADFWRFMVVHLWVEDFLEIFTTVLVAYLFVMLGVVRQRVALTVIYLDIVLYSVGGVIGTMHHLYFSGSAAETMALGAFFSAAEVLPLTFLTVEAWSFLQLGSRQERSSATPFPHRWAVMFLVAVGFWNFLGAGIFGFLVNLPVVSYYEIGTALTANHAHAAMMGVYGMLAIGLALFCLRYLIPDRPLAGQAGQDLLLVLQSRPGLDVLRDPAAARDPAAVQVRQRGLLRRPAAGVHHQPEQQPVRVDAAAR